jgi:hypothetical protein
MEEKFILCACVCVWESNYNGNFNFIFLLNQGCYRFDMYFWFAMSLGEDASLNFQHKKPADMIFYHMAIVVIL